MRLEPQVRVLFFFFFSTNLLQCILRSTATMRSIPAMAGMDLKDMDTGMTADTDVVICIRIRRIRIHVPGGYSVPVSNTTGDSARCVKGQMPLSSPSVKGGDDPELVAGSREHGRIAVRSRYTLWNLSTYVT